VTPDEARELVIDGINYAAYRETDSALHDSDKNGLFGSDHYKSDRAKSLAQQFLDDTQNENRASQAMEHVCPHASVTGVWIDGGWGVDALLGVQTRPHKDLDVAVEPKQVAALREFLHKQEYRDTKLEIARPYA
jgi:hypothetical protein